MMDIEKIEAPEGNLLNLLNEISPLEWRRYQQRYPKIWIEDHFEEGDHSNLPPYVAFRFKNESVEIVERLQNIVENRPGNISWVLRRHKRKNLYGSNFVIEPKIIWEMRERLSNTDLYIDRHKSIIDRDLCQKAYDDISDLADYIRQMWKYT